MNTAVDAALVGARISQERKEFHPTVIRALAASTPAPGSHEAYVQFLKDTALSIGKRAVISALMKELPAQLTTGFVGALFNPILGFAVAEALTIALNETEIGLFFLYIDLRTSAQGRDFESAARKNLEKQKSGTPEERAAAEKELVDAFRALAKFTN